MDETIVLTDKAGKTLPCYVEATLDIKGTDYFLLQPVDYPAYIFAWAEDEVLEILAEDEIEKVFDIARAVLAEQNLTLINSAYVPTIGGELDDVAEEDIVKIDSEDEDESEEYQELAHFFHEEQEYSIFTNIDPVLFFATRDDIGSLTLLSPEELEEIQPFIEENIIEADEEI